ncbi:histidine--tRNA ligase [candidate division WOR-3 bacterium]|nr:histidine--tRNA ligase [candidate division WOR-3 bacterium]
MNLNPVRGMRDFYPEEMKKREWLFSVWREVSQLWGFDPYDAPVVENLELLTRKAGEEISEQLYSFKDKSGRDLALRAEMTPSLARMIAAKQNALQIPIKWFTIAQCFRYERMTKGRKREHYQWNADILGVHDITAEAEIISMLVAAVLKLGLDKDEFVVKLNSRKVVEDILKKAGLDDGLLPPAMIVIDKKDKVSEPELLEMLGKATAKKAVPEKILELYRACETEGLKSVLGENENTAEVESLIENLGDYKDYVVLDPSVVRGLSYYTGIVFEMYSRAGHSRAIAGGGRYDGLLEKIGGKPLSGVGFGFGDVVIMDILEEMGKLIQNGSELDFYIIPLEKNRLRSGFELALAARRENMSADLDFKCRKIKSALSEGAKKGARFCAVLFPDEFQNGMIKVKNMKTQEERTVSVGEFPAVF